MTDWKREEMYDRTQMLLWDIREELRKLNAKLDANTNQDKDDKSKAEKACKHCGEVHEKPID
jgi:Skp family chaperone for outer membrane proteins